MENVIRRILTSVVMFPNFIHFRLKLYYKISKFYRKAENAISFSVIKISTPTNFMRLRSKLKSEIGQKVESSDREVTQIWLETCTFSFFCHEKPLLLEKKQEALFYFRL